MRAKSAYYVDVTSLPNEPGFAEVADRVYDRVCRSDFAQPGFMLLNLPAVSDSFQLRRIMVELKQHLHAIHQRKSGKSLVYTFLGRFDQQETTKPHRDGGPAESVLLLGYEPTPIRSHLFIFDDMNCAFDWGVELQQIPPPYDPLLTEIEPMVSGYMTPVEGLDPQSHQILAINNSCLPFREGQSTMLGVLHHAVIENRSAEARRIVNSMMIASMDPSEAEPISQKSSGNSCRPTR